jgi:nucleoside-diphosphate-sugar epimerase
MREVKGRAVLVTGGAGFLGERVVRALLGQGARVRVLDNMSTGPRARLSDIERRIEVLDGDIRNAVACRNASRGIEIVFHLAAWGSAASSLRDPVTSDAVNIGGTLNVLMAARDAGVKRLVFGSSLEVYGECPQLADEATLPHPLSPYAVGKLYGEQMCRLFTLHHGLETVSLRFATLYGPSERLRGGEESVIPLLAAAAEEKKSACLHGAASDTRDYLHVNDAVRATLLAACAEVIAGETLNIAFGRALTIAEAAALVNRALGVRRKPVFSASGPGEPRHVQASVRKARELLGFEAEIAPEEGLRETTACYRNAIGNA